MLWSEKVFYLEQSKRNVQVEAKWHEGIFLGMKNESEIAAVGTPHGIFSRSILWKHMSDASKRRPSKNGSSRYQSSIMSEVYVLFT